MVKRMQYCAFCGEQLGIFESWGEPESCGNAECDREIRYMLQSQESERRERAESDHYDRY